MNAKIILGSVSLGARNDHLKNQPDFRNPRLQAVYLRKRRAKMQKTTGKRLQATGQKNLEILPNFLIDSHASGWSL